MVWVIAFGELFFGGLWCVVWGYGGMRTHFSLLNPELRISAGWIGSPYRLDRLGGFKSLRRGTNRVRNPSSCS